MPPKKLSSKSGAVQIGKILLDHQALPLVQYNTYRWYLRELAKLFRTKTGWNLGLELEICLRKWVAYSLDPELLQALLCECYFRIGAMTPGAVQKNPKHETRMTIQGGKPEARIRDKEPATRTRRRKAPKAKAEVEVGGANG